MNLQAHGGADIRAPIVLQCPAVATADVDARQRACSGVEPGCQNDDIELVDRPVRRLHAVRGHALDRIVLDADDFDIGTMEGFQEVLFERHAVRSEAVVGRGRNQQFAQLWILQPLAHLLAHEFRYLPVDLLVEEHLAEGGEPQLQRTVVPAVFQHLATPSGREIGPGMFEIILEAGERTG